MSKRRKSTNTIKETVMMAAGIILLAAGVFLLCTSILLNLVQYSSAQEEIASYKEELSKEIDVTNESLIAKEDTPQNEEAETDVSLRDALYILRIPKIDSENLVREGTSSSVLSDALGHEAETAYIGEKGNCVIAGHRNYSFGKYFNRLNEVEIGDDIYVDAMDGTHSYKVSEIKVVTPDQIEILDDTEDEQLTLYTCTPIYIATHRLVIIAKPVGE